MKRIKNILMNIGTCFLAMCLLFGFSTNTNAQGLVPDSVEYVALKALYDSLDGPNWTNNTNWLVGNTNSDFANWYGVTTANGDVSAISLNNNQLSGIVPADISYLTEITFLSLSGNNIQEVPFEIGSLTNLISLYLNTNQLTELSIDFNSGMNLQSLLIANNHLSTLPSNMANLDNLEFLNANGNDFNEFPLVLTNITSLTNISVGGNNISQLPPQIENLVNLFQLSMNYSRLSTLPLEIANLPLLKALALGYNEFTSFPMEVIPLPALEIVNLAGNSIKIIPPEISQSLSLLTLAFNDNQISELPAGIGSMTNLKYVRLASNKFTEFPTELLDVSNLESVDLSNNQIKTIPSEIGNLTNLRSIVLSNNLLTSLPVEIPNNLIGLFTTEIQNNKLNFAQIEPFFNGPNSTIYFGLTYSPQASLTNSETIGFQVGNSLLLSIDTPGQYNQYQWQKLNGTVWEDITGAITDTHTITSTTAADVGTQYRCKVTNTWATDLTLYTGEYTLEEALPLTPNQALNYIVSNSIIKENVTTENEIDNLTVDQKNKSVEYFDGLGRGIQSVIVQGSPDKNDVVQHRQYDAFGRQANDYLPYAAYMLAGNSKDDGSFKSRPLNDLLVFYNPINIDPEVQDIASDIYYLAQKKFEPSPLNRVAEQGAFGEAWQPNPNDENGKTIKFGYHVNEATQVRHWFIGNGFPQTNNYYSAGRLTLNIVTDEEGNETKEYTDKLGRVVLKEVENLKDNGDVEWLSTYYVYDDFDNLRFVFPPKAVDELIQENWELANFFDPILLNLSFQYSYDERQRMIMKKVPGAEPVYMVYDQFDRLVFTQDGNQFGRSEWSFTKYDHLNRPVMTGTMVLTNTWGTDRMAYRDTVEDALDNYYNTHLSTNQNHRYESYSAVDNWGYTDRSYPQLTLGAHEILTVTYYDNYNFVEDDVLGRKQGTYDFRPELGLLNNDTFRELKGQVTGLRTKVLGETKYLNTVTYYDDRYRVIQTITDNYTLGFDRVTTEYDFSGRVLRTIQTHSRGKGNFEDLVVNQSFSYDHASRLLNTYHRIGSQDSVLLTANSYNEIGELVEKNLHATDMASPVYKQSVDYRYNIRGWLTQINNSALSTSDANATEPDYFGMNLYYNEKVAGLSYGMVNNWQDPLNGHSPYFHHMLNGVPIKPIISYKNPDLYIPANTQPLNWDNKFGIDYKQINPKLIKAKISSDKKPGMGFRYLKSSPVRTSGKASPSRIIADEKELIAENDSADDPLTQYITTEVFLNVDPGTLTASLDASPWIYKDFTEDKDAENNPVNATLVEELWLEAECGTRGANWTMVNDGDASNNNYMVVASGTSQLSTPPASADDHLSFTFNIVNTGNFKVWGRALTTSANDDSFWVRMDGGSWIKWNSIPSGSWQWDDVHDSDNSGTAVTFNLTAGSHTFDIALREVGAKIDKLYISDTGTTPTGTGSAATNCVATAPPADPTGLVADRTSYSYIELAWDANAQIVDDYTLERSVDNTNFTVVATPAGNLLSFRDNTILAGTSYYYRLRANNHLGSSNFTTSLNVSSLANPGVVTDQLLLHLDARSTGSYPGSGATWFDLSPNANDATLSNYSFNGTDLSFTYSGTQVITDEDIAIAQNQAFSVGFWINPSDNSRPNSVKSSNDYGAFNFSVRSGYPGSIEVGIGTTDATKIARTDLPAGLLVNNQDQYFVYTYDNNIASLYKNGEFVYSKDIGAMTSAWTKFKLGYALGKFNAAQVYGKALTPDEILHNYFIGYGNTATGVPATPTGLIATALSISQIALSWTDVAIDEIYYLVERSTDGVNFSPVKYLPAGTTSYEDQGLNAATTYTYRVVAVNTAGSSGATNTQATATDNLPSINIASDALELYLDAGNTSSFNGAGTGKALNDISGKNNHAMLDDGVTAVGGHLQFSDQGFSAPLPALTAGTTNFSIGFWMRPTAAGYRYNSVQATSSEFGNGAFFSRNDAVNFRYLTGVTSTNMFDSYSTYILNEWAYFVYTYDNGTARMYKNGVEFNDSPKAQDPVTLDFEGIALKQGYGDFDVLQVYSKTLTGAEVFQNYEIHKNRYFVPTEAPPAPTALAVNQTTQNEIKITWTDNADNEDKYVVEFAINEAGPFAVLDEVIVNVSNYAHSNLNPNQVFYYRVKGENSIGSSAYSNVISAKTLSAATVVPAAPTGLSANVQSYNRVSLSWNDVAIQEDEYQVERSLDGNTYSLLATLPFNTTSYEDSGLDPNTTYYYRVKALNWIGSSPVSNTVNSTTTSMPDFSVVMNGIKLYLDATLTMSYDGTGTSWFDLSGQGNDAVLDAGVAKENGRLHFTDQGFEAPLPGFLSGITNFSVGFWMRPDAQGYAYNDVSSINAANLVGAYYAFNEGGTRMVTGVLNNRFGPYNIYELGNWVYMVYTYDNGTGRLYKNGSLLNGPTAQGAVDTDFEAMILSGGHGDFEILQVYDKTLTDAEVLQNYNADKDRYMSTAAVPAAPTGLAASVISKSQINLSWTENATNEGNYLIEVSSDGGVNYQTLVSLPSATNSFEHAGLPPGQTVHYRVLATNSTGNSSYSNVVNATTYLEEPTTLAGQPHLSYQVDLSWADVAQNEAGYELERKLTSGGTYALVHTTAADVTTYSDNGLNPETSYDYRIRAVNGTNYSVYSNEITVTTGINPPTSLSLTPVSAAQIDISWVDNTAIETGYVLERSLSSNSGFAEVATLGANVTSYQDNSLLAETTYFYRVKAINANGSSSYSSTEGASTLPLIISNPDLDYESTTYYNGNISAITWQTYNSQQEQGYTYVYDPVNRIKGASHVRATGPGTWNTSDAGFNVGNIKYDYNGNIESLKRQARNVDGTYVIDDLAYTYEDNGVSNRLLAVADSAANKEGFDDGSTGSVDYDYDANGNLAGDANKNIDTIEYNILNLPQRILFTGGNEILYTYDAAGTKLRKEVREDVDGTIVKTVTDYMSGVQYTINEFEAAGETTSRDFVMTPEGRATPEDALAAGTTYNYEYNLTDHLGNVRVTFTTKQETPDEYNATFETSLQASEALDFQNYGDAVINNVNLYNNTPDSVVTGATRSQRLSGIQGEVIGLAKSLAVVPGDVIDMEVYAKYLDGSGNGPGLGGILTTIAEAFGVSATSTGDGLQAYNAINGLLSVPSYMTLANTKAANGYQVFLNYLLFDKDYNYLDAGYDQMAGTANAVVDPNVAHELMSKSVTIQKPGYIYIYLSNESGQIVETFFDDFKITHTKSPIISADDYYPFGLAINQNSYQRESAVDQRYKYNGKELQPELGLNWTDYGARMYDAAIGRWHVIDPLAEASSDLTPYRYGFNNPLRFIDPDGTYESVSDLITDAWNKTRSGENRQFTYKNGNQTGDQDGKELSPREIAYSFFNSNTQVLPTLDGQNEIWGRVKNLFKSNRTIEIGDQDFIVNHDGFIDDDNFNVILVVPELPIGPGAPAKAFRFASYTKAFIKYAKHVKNLQYVWKSGSWKAITNAGSLARDIKGLSGYINAAKKLFTSSKNTISFVSKQGTIFKYNLKTGHFGVANSEGIIQTFYKIEKGQGLKYFVEQIGKYGY
ncbi:fibronectin type III domain-containing protein [Fulvivirgaceae bacterium BMA12]|uniref:Fibronectin type III domain-containing protein n=1 Tax=Agaribacillus aureus TaxID=3051825 RepID=A0ABT8LKS2_9BACT|nr:fibronectin type III domain-containing protein [Fulvivirgaceae bacterium BMA12]